MNKSSWFELPAGIRKQTGTPRFLVGGISAEHARTTQRGDRCRSPAGDARGWRDLRLAGDARRSTMRLHDTAKPRTDP
jgi:hypothetical protein